MNVDPNDIHEAALDAGATVLGDPDTKRHYLMTAAQIAALLEAFRKAPVPLPPPPY